MSYVIDGGEEGKARLNILGNAMNHYSMRVLAKAGLKSGDRCLDAGCGGGTMTYAMAAIVGETGHVSGIDYDPAVIELNRQELAANKIHNVSFRQADVNEWDETGIYDIIFARFLLSHLKDPASALGRMVQALKPGGCLVAEDLQFSAHFCYPANEAFATYLHWYTMVVNANGGNPELGIELHRYLAAAGLVNIQLEIAQPAGIEGPAKQMSLLTLEKIKNALLVNNITTEEGFSAVRQQLKEFTEDEDTLISIPRTFQVWAYKPLS